MSDSRERRPEAGNVLLKKAEYLADHLFSRVLRVFEKVVLQIPSNSLDFRPTPENMSAKELSYHVYQVVFLLVRAVETGRQDSRDLDLIPFDPDQITRAEEIVEYGRKITEYARAKFPTLTEAAFLRPIKGSVRESGVETIMLALEEAIHHRGQLMTYLRLMGVKPGHLYDRV